MEEQVEVKYSDVLSVGIEINKHLHQRKINQREPLKDILAEICKEHGLEGNEKYGLQFDKHPVFGFSFISEENRHAIKNGSVCKLVYSPAHMVHTILGKMVSPGGEENIWSLEKMISFIGDKLFVQKFVESSGVTILITILQGNALSAEATGYAFKCLSELLQQNYIPISCIKDRIVQKVIRYILNDEKCSTRSQESCLSIANFLMENHASEFPEIIQSVSIENIIPFLRSDDFCVQKTALCFINSLFNRANPLQRKLLIKSHSKEIRDIIYETLIKTKRTVSEDMLHQLGLFQSRFVSRLRRKAESPVDMKDNTVKRRISLLAQLALQKEEVETEQNNRRNTYIENTLTMLSDYVVPCPSIEADDFPPSILVLDCMTHFIKTYQQNYTRAVLAHSWTAVGSKYPFIQLCSELISLLTDCLGIMAQDGEYPYHPVLYSIDKAFEEIFCATIMVFSKTAKEMRASKEDYQKIINVMRKKIQVALSKKPLTVKDFESKFYTINYNEVSKIWQEEQEIKERLELKEKKSLLQLKEILKPEYLILIRKQRLNVLCAGSYVKYFSKANKIKNKVMFAKYVPSKKLFEFVDEEDRCNNFCVELYQIKSIVVGQDCTHVKTSRGQKLRPEFAFSLMLLPDMEPNCVNLAATSEKQLCYIMDGFRTLLGMEMTSSVYEEELQSLLDVHVRLQLLDAHGVDLPAGDAPPIPPPPPNFDFLP
ncbi:hypothetical protein B566_EDAN017489 [Ephemera danica]|nr:hypothetical protein B566_EDAN017489 [Ephemera danica]